jgi:PAS domain S-box-containing protein
MAGQSHIDYGSQVRLFALLLFLFLMTLLLGSTYLFGQSRARLALEMERSLLLAARSAADLVRADPGWEEEGQPARLSPKTTKALEALRTQADLARVVVWYPGGGHVVFGPPGILPPTAAVNPAQLGGRPLLSDFFEGEGGQYGRAYTLPLLGEGGRVRGAVTAEVRNDFLGFLHRVRWMILASYGIGLTLALLCGLLFVRSILKPYITLRSAARDFQQIEPAASPAASGDIEFVAQTFQRMIDVLKAKEAELSRLYAAERERAQHLERYQEDILGSITSGVMSCRPDGAIAVFNRTAQQIFGYREAEVLGRPCAEAFGAESPLTRVVRDGLERGRTHSRLEFTVRRRDGAARWIGLSSSLLRGKAGQDLGLTVLLTDLTEIMLLRRQVLLKESLATLGEMSAGIAHEFRNSLGAIRGFVRLLQRAIGENAKGGEHVRDILAEIEQLEGILKDFLSFARPVELQLAEVSLGGLMDEAVASCREAIERAGVTLSRHLTTEAVQVWVDPTLIKQALVNLIRNACEAMPDGGTLTLGAGLVPVEAAEAPGGFEERGHWVELLVADTGTGIPPADQDRVFNPFFTTKDSGTGLGLAQVQKTVVAHGGRVELQSSVAVGSLFRVLLPHRGSPRGARVAPEAAGEPAWSGS